MAKVLDALTKEKFNGAEGKEKMMDFSLLLVKLNIASTSTGVDGAIECTNEEIYLEREKRRKADFEKKFEVLDSRAIEALKRVKKAKEALLEDLEKLALVGVVSKEEVETLQGEIVKLNGILIDETNKSGKTQVYKAGSDLKWAVQQNKMLAVLISMLGGIALKKVNSIVAEENNYTKALIMLKGRYGENNKNTYDVDQIEKLLKDIRIERGNGGTPLDVFDKIEFLVEDFNSTSSVKNGMKDKKGDKEIIQYMLNATKGDAAWDSWVTMYEVQRTSKDGVSLLDPLQLARVMQLHIQRYEEFNEGGKINKITEGEKINKTSEVTCYECKKTGHMKRECPNIICNSCNKKGHMERNCPGNKVKKDKFDKKRFDRSKERRKDEESPPPHSGRKVGEKKKGLSKEAKKEIMKIIRKEEEKKKSYSDDSEEEDSEENAVINSFYKRNK